MTIGYILQEISTTDVLTLDEISAINITLQNLLNINGQPQEVIMQAANAYNNLLIFVDELFKHENERNNIFQVIYNLFGHPSVEVRVLAMQCLVEIVRLYYDHLQLQYENILKLTVQYVSSSINFRC
jgi:importin subunit beta-1